MRMDPANIVFTLATNVISPKSEAGSAAGTLMRTRNVDTDILTASVLVATFINICAGRDLLYYDSQSYSYTG